MNNKLYKMMMIGLFLINQLSFCFAQTNDVTVAYLDNASFDSNFDYQIGDEGNVAQELLDVTDWTRPAIPNYTIGGVYQFGTAKTFNGVALPSTAYDTENVNGGGLALSTGWNQQLTYYKDVSLVPGKYSIVTAIYNCADKTAGKSLVGWIPSSGTSSISKISSFPVGKWITDTVSFEVSSTISGKIQLGLEAGSNGSANSAKIIVDFIKILRDSPLGTADIDYRKTILLSVISTATFLYADGKGNDASSLSAAISSSIDTYNDATIDLNTVISSTSSLNAAILSYRYANSTGDIPTVETDKSYAVGSTAAFGRMTISGVTSSEIKEQGFCWSENPLPTINDNKTVRYLSNNGRMFWMKRLTPSTVYYARPYVITTGYSLTYGEPIRIVTLPKGNVTYGLRSGCPDDVATRLNSAVGSAVNYWNTFTHINGLYLSVGYGSGTPTAECSYGGWMTVGPNESYQKTGTIMHEALHAIGVGTTSQWYGPNSPLRETGESGLWLGVRANRMVQFLNNDSTACLHGDKMHMWPYGVNGANEDTGTDLLYIGNSLMAEAVCEDGLPPTGGFAVAGHVFEEQDKIKYYIKNESSDRGLYTSFLVEDKTGNLKWSVVDDISSDDNAAWYISFNPSDCYYMLKNVATGKYISCSSDGVISMKSDVSSNGKFQFLPCHVSALNSDKLQKNGFWIIHPENIAAPKCLEAGATGNIAASTFDLSDDSKTQRWLFLTYDEASHVADEAHTLQTKTLNEMIANVEKLLNVTHTEDIAGSDDALKSVLSTVKATDVSVLSCSEIGNLVDEVKNAGMKFLSGVTPIDIAQPFDISFLITNAGMDATDGWSEQPSISYSCAEFYQKAFNISQEIDNLPVGTYLVKSQAFQRTGTVDAVYSSFLSGKSSVNAYLYANREQSKVANICTGAQNSKLGGSESAVAANVYLPNDQQSAALYFNKGLYDNGVVLSLTSAGSIIFGLRSSSYSDSYWTAYDNFRLYYYGSMDKSVITAVKNISKENKSLTDVYNIYGICVKRNTDNLDGLKDGIYIMKGEKIIKKGK